MNVLFAVAATWWIILALVAQWRGNWEHTRTALMWAILVVLVWRL